MGDFAYDDQHDVLLDPNSKDIEVTNDDLQQGIVIFLNTNQGELSWNPTFGVDMLQIIMDIHNEATLSSELEEWLTGYFDEIDSVVVDSVTFNKRTATINLKIVVNNGDDIQLGLEVDDDGIND
ncbi:hypothetical protein IWT25_00775 [Secundilactobacillus pentosiphilus]|uniref:Uncharacterized protein n=1 Tax=Secundilactobacillus pentosiphilus TaxID=1714682 RepID=A0A1Z5IUU4_9LACO|nr:hypothetical protein [Secundilactobacillus pentosiphilus]GAX05469.1 hypothetical protein IWT25_00775 [Secundilactobacillus pentosiphilus]